MVYRFIVGTNVYEVKAKTALKAMDKMNKQIIASDSFVWMDVNETTFRYTPGNFLD